MKWFRLWTDILDDVKMLQLSDYEFRMWTYLMAIASEVDSMSGECQLNVKSMSLRCRTQVNHLSKAFETFQNVGLIVINELGFPVITNWNKRQYKSDDSYSRVKKHREVKQKRNVSCNGNETPPDTDTDTDTDNAPIVPKKRGTIYTDDFSSFWKAYPKKVGKDAAWKAWKVRNGDRPKLEILISSIETQRGSDQWRKNNGQFIPNPSTWLNQGRWADDETVIEPLLDGEKTEWGMP